MKIKKLMGMALACMFTLGVSSLAFADGETYKVTEKAEGENLVVTLDFVGGDVAAGNYHFDYDTETYSLVSAVKGSAGATMMTINDKTAGMVKGNFLYTEGYDGGATDVVVITLKMLNGTYDKTKLGLSSFSLSDINSTALADQTTVAEAPAVAFTCTHNWDAGKVNKEATCTAEGEKEYICSICGDTKKEAIAKKDHAWDEGKVTTEATYDADGVKTFTCADCGATKTEAIAKLVKATEAPAATVAPTVAPTVTPTEAPAATKAANNNSTKTNSGNKTSTAPKTADSTLPQGIAVALLVLSAGTVVATRRKWLNA